MGDKDKLISDEESVQDKAAIAEKVAKLAVKANRPWYFEAGFLLFWATLFLAIVVPLFYRLPTPLTVHDTNQDVFIAERAHKTLAGLANIGTKVVGSQGNEVYTVQFLLAELELIKQQVLLEYYDIEIDVQIASGSYIHWTMINMYQGVQNIVIKLSPKGSTSETYLLVNSHFDSKPTSPSVGDAGHMVTTMLEVLRVISTSKQSFQHPIVFLLNGAEENPLQASHAFITQHKWAPFCKAVINLDAAGTGGREILFQSGPYNPWLLKYYKESAKHPFGTTMGEEIFQTGLLPSDTDFGIFNTYGNLVGFDLAQCINGFVYHTKYDELDVIPQGALQNTGDNILNLVRALSNAPELYDTEAFASGHAIFFDFLGLFFISYSSSNGEYLNYGVAGAAIILIFVSLWRIAAVSNVSQEDVRQWAILVLVIQVIAFVLGLALPIVVAYALDLYGKSLSYYSSPLLVVGLFVCPSLVGLSLPSTIYYTLYRNSKVSFAHYIQLALHGHAVVLAVLGVALTYYGLRSAYVITWTLIFYVIPLAINLLTTLHDRGYAWTTILKLFQIFPFLYNSYLFYTFVVVLTPMMGRYGMATNPDLIVSALTALGTILSMGFLILLVNMFRRPSIVFVILLAVSALSIFAATSTDIGFPYRPKTNVERINYLQVRRVFYEYDGAVSWEDSGYAFYFQDRRGPTPLEESGMPLTGLVSLESNCTERMMCGVPLYDHRWVKSRLNIMWLPREQPIDTPAMPTLKLLSKTVQADGITVRFVFEVTGPDHTSLFIQPFEDVTISNWSFLQSYLQTTSTYPPPFHIYFSYGIDSSPLNFFIDIMKPNGDFNVQLFELGVAGQFLGSVGDAESVKFAESFSAYSAIVQWPASYQRYIF
ncbi:endoplasmic reticulum metallopeptidase 1-like [Drosophila miranda]|uniref:endoplasmic reticulum metallopeptidase 1-like n=1 Tax=Drosophila miranda TaxID=7229 RepID=UPI0007E63499|nr:endoplasmic reticulum metallopeptidase 1-like [Drosophila miranda]